MHAHRQVLYSSNCLGIRDPVPPPGMALSGEHCTVVELATYNGVGGRHGKANWYHDKLDPK